MQKEVPINPQAFPVEGLVSDLGEALQPGMTLRE